MINFFYIIGGVFALFLICKIIYKFTQFKIVNYISFFFAIILTICLVFTATVTTAPDDVLEKMITVEAPDKEVDRSGSMYLSSGSGIHLSNEFYFSTDTDKKELGEYLNKCSRDINLVIKKGDNYLYSKNLGRINDSYAEKLIEQYDRWQETGLIPTDKVRYKFLIFYFDLNF